MPIKVLWHGTARSERAEAYRKSGGNGPLEAIGAEDGALVDEPRRYHRIVDVRLPRLWSRAMSAPLRVPCTPDGGVDDRGWVSHPNPRSRRRSAASLDSGCVLRYELSYGEDDATVRVVLW